jgi:hypothetical protein
MVSATSFTLVGVVNKFLTVLLNVMAWEKHSTPFGIFAVCLCLAAGFFYQPAPRRDVSRKEIVATPLVQLVASEGTKESASLLQMEGSGIEKK